MDRQLRKQFIPGYRAAQILGIGSHLLARITGIIFVTKGAKEADIEHAGKINIGLNLKSNKRNEEVSGYTQKNAKNTWLYSPKVLDALREYMQKFPEVFTYLSGKDGSNGDYYNENDVFPDVEDVPEKMKELSDWIRDQPFYNASRQPCGTLNLDDHIVSLVEEIVDELAENQPKKKKITMQLKPHLIFKPSLSKGSGAPDQEADYWLFDRVVNIREGFSVPLGLRGTIIGVMKADRPEDSYLEVLFDQDFHGGLAIKTSNKKVYRVPRTALINISHGKRMDAKSNGAAEGQKVKPMAIVQPIDQGQRQSYANSVQNIPSTRAILVKEDSPVKHNAVKHVTPPDPRSLPTPTDFLQGSSSRRGRGHKNNGFNSSGAQNYNSRQNKSFDMNQLWDSLQQPQVSGPPPVAHSMMASGPDQMNANVQQFFSQAVPAQPPTGPTGSIGPTAPYAEQNFGSTAFVPLQVSIRGSKGGRSDRGHSGGYGGQDRNFTSGEGGGHDHPTLNFSHPLPVQGHHRGRHPGRGGGSNRRRNGHGRGRPRLAANFSHPQ